jgi:dipeptidyl aminopeptidase/acylaminoacyl peptidase
MRMLHRWLAVVWIVVPCTAAAAAPPPDAAAFGLVPQVSHVALAPGGRYVSWADQSGSPSVVIFDFDAGQVVRRVALTGGLKLRTAMWADDRVVVLGVSVTATARFTNGRRYEFLRYLTIDRETGATGMLLTEGRTWVTGSRLLGRSASGNGNLVMSVYDFDPTLVRAETGTRIRDKGRDDGQAYTAFEVSAHTGEVRRLFRGSPFTIDWLLDASGNIVARLDRQSPGERRIVLARRGNEFVEIGTSGDSALDMEAVSADGKSILAVTSNGGERVKLWSIPLDGSGMTVLRENPQADVADVLTDPFDGKALAVIYNGGDQPVEWLDATAGKRTAALARALKAPRVTPIDRSADGKRVLYSISGPSTPRSYYLVDYATGKAEVVGESYPRLSGVALGEVRQVDYAARDGTRIPAYLTLPPQPAGTAAASGPRPLVVLPHGGPEANDDFGFDWWAQFLASRGYVVLQPQFRGSTGFGEAHRLAGYRQWGKRMQDDVSDGVKAMVSQGIADPQRVCIVGASYGGYAALAGAAFTPELYACAISVAGISDLSRLIGYVTSQVGRGSDSVEYWRDHIGQPGTPAVVATSPINSIATIRAPILLLHGADDTVVPLDQSQRMADALKAAGKPHVFKVLPGEDHWLSGSATRLRMLQEIDGFLARYLKPAAP